VSQHEDLFSSPDAGTRFANRRSVPRYPFIARVEILEPISKAQLKGRITEISLKGCFTEVSDPMQANTIIQISILHTKGTYEMWGRVAYARSGAGMGVAFLQMYPENEAAIRDWIAGIS